MFIYKTLNKKANPNKEIIYYILPQVWAWKPWRTKILEKYFDILAEVGFLTRLTAMVTVQANF